MIKWLFRLAWMFGILGFAGTIAIILLIWRNERNGRPKYEIIQTDSVIKVPVIIKRDTVFIDRYIDSSKLRLNQPDSVTIKPPAVDTPKQVQQSIAIPAPKQEIPKPKADTIAAKPKIKATEPEVAKKKITPEKKSLTKEDLQVLLKRVNKSKVYYKLSSSCVQLRGVEGNNNKVAISQVEDLLRRHHYSIAGRETISAEVKGIKIISAGPCLRVIVGKL